MGLFGSSCRLKFFGGKIYTKILKSLISENFLQHFQKECLEGVPKKNVNRKTSITFDAHDEIKQNKHFYKEKSSNFEKYSKIQLCYINYVLSRKKN